MSSKSTGLPSEYRFYGFNSYMELLQPVINYSPEQNTGVCIKEYSNASIIPYGEVYENNQLSYPRFGCVLDNNGEIILDSCSYWTNTDHDDGMHIGKINKNYNFNKLDTCQETVVYLGHSDDHFGHFLIDSMQRFYLIDKYKKFNIKFAYIGKSPSKFVEMFYLAGIDPEKLIYINTPRKYSKIVVGSPSAKYPCYYSNYFRSGFDNIRNNLKSEIRSPKKIYFSRSHLPGYGKTYGEEAYEAIFKRNGYLIIYPELLPLRSQLSLVKNCEIMVGTSGSAMHLALFAPDNIQCSYFERSKHISKCQFLIIDRMKKIRSSYIESFVNPIPVNECCCPYLVGLNEHVEKFFNDKKIVFKNNDFMNFDNDMLSFFDHWCEARSRLQGNYAINTSDITADGIEILFAAVKKFKKPAYLWRSRLEQLKNLMQLVK